MGCPLPLLAVPHADDLGSRRSRDVLGLLRRDGPVNGRGARRRRENQRVLPRPHPADNAARANNRRGDLGWTAADKAAGRLAGNIRTNGLRSPHRRRMISEQAIRTLHPGLAGWGGGIRTSAFRNRNSPRLQPGAAGFEPLHLEIRSAELHLASTMTAAPSCGPIGTNRLFREPGRVRLGERVRLSSSRYGSLLLRSRISGERARLETRDRH
jgi:hypothetical protein